MNRVFATLLAVSAVLSGCSTPYSPPTIYGDFDGIKTLSRNGKTVKVIAIHGITDTPEGWAIKIRQGLEKSLQLTPMADATDRITITPKGGYGTAGYLNVYRYGLLEFYELTWSPTTRPIKEKYLKYDRVPQYVEKRATFNNDIKTRLVNDGLSDAIIYMGPTKDALQDTVAQSLCFALVPDVSSNEYCDFSKREISASPNDQIVFITHSLGSVKAK